MTNKLKVVAVVVVVVVVVLVAAFGVPVKSAVELFTTDTEMTPK